MMIPGFGLEPGMSYPGYPYCSCGGFCQHGFGNRRMTPQNAPVNGTRKGQGGQFGYNPFPQSMSPWSRFIFGNDDVDQFRAERKGQSPNTQCEHMEEDETVYKPTSHRSPSYAQTNIPIRVSNEKPPVSTPRSKRKQSTSSPTSTTNQCVLQKCSQPNTNHNQSPEKQHLTRNRNIDNRGSSDPPGVTGETGTEQYQAEENTDQNDSSHQLQPTVSSSELPINLPELMQDRTVSPATEDDGNLMDVGQQHSGVCTEAPKRVPITFENSEKSSVETTRNQNNLPECTTQSNVSHNKIQSPADEPPITFQPEEPKMPLTPVNRLQKIHDEVKDLKAAVVNFSGSKKSKEFLYLDEMLTRKLLMVDVIETEGIDEIRQKRKAVVEDINNSISLLESKCEEQEITADSKNKEQSSELRQ